MLIKIQILQNIDIKVKDFQGQSILIKKKRFDTYCSNIITTRHPSLCGCGLLGFQDCVDRGQIGSPKDRKLSTSGCSLRLLQQLIHTSGLHSSKKSPRSFQRPRPSSIPSPNPYSSFYFHPLENPQTRIIRAVIKKERLLTFCDVQCHEHQSVDEAQRFCFTRSRVGPGICTFYLFPVPFPRSPPPPKMIPMCSLVWKPVTKELQIKM